LPLPPGCGLQVGIAREYDQLRDPMRVANLPTWRPQMRVKGAFPSAFRGRRRESIRCATCCAGCEVCSHEDWVVPLVEVPSLEAS
jgi:hypothetical protein